MITTPVSQFSPATQKMIEEFEMSDEARMTEEKCKSLFAIAGIPVLAMWELPNGYWPHHPLKADADYREIYDYVRYAKLRDESPWWLVKTPFGLIQIGWRKRVISINWSDTLIRKIVTEDDTTKDLFYVHAWSELDAAKYLKALGTVDAAPPLELDTMNFTGSRD